MKKEPLFTIEDENLGSIVPTLKGDKMFTDEQIKLIEAKTPEDKLEKYGTPNANIELTGVKWPYCLSCINKIVGVGNWGCEIDVTNVTTEVISEWFSLSLPVKCFILDEDRKMSWWYETVGVSSVKDKGPYGQMVKAAQADGIKKCFVSLGFWSDVYSGETTIKEPKPSKVLSRGGTISMTDEEKKQAKTYLSDLKKKIKEVQAVLKSKDDSELTVNQQKLKEWSKKDMLNFFREVLIKASADGVDGVSFDVSEQINDYSDIHTNVEWTLIYNKTLGKINKIME